MTVGSREMSWGEWVQAMGDALYQSGLLGNEGDDRLAEEARWFATVVADALAGRIIPGAMNEDRDE